MNEYVLPDSPIQATRNDEGVVWPPLSPWLKRRPDSTGTKPHSRPSTTAQSMRSWGSKPVRIAWVAAWHQAQQTPGARLRKESAATPPTTGTHAVVLRSILADQRNHHTLELQSYAAYLDTPLLWQLGQAVQGRCQSVSLAGWQHVHPTPLRALVLCLGNTLTSLDLSHSTVNADTLHQVLPHLFALRTLKLVECQHLIDLAMSPIVAGTRDTLTSLDVTGSRRLSHDALLWLAGCVGQLPEPMHCLRSLTISECPLIKDAGLVALGGACFALQFVALDNCTHVTAKGIAGLVRGATALQVLSMSRCDRVADSGIQAVGACLPQLRSLNVSRLTLLSDAAIIAVANGCSQLQTLDVSGCDLVTENACYHLMLNCPGLYTLNVSGCSHVSHRGLQAMVAGRPFVQEATGFFGFVLKNNNPESLIEESRRVLLQDQAIKIQSRLRGFQCRRRLSAASLFSAHYNATLTAQRLVRGFLTRKYVLNERRAQVADAAARLLQRWTRWNITRKHVRAHTRWMTQARSQSGAIARVQAAFRGRLTRRLRVDVRDAIAWRRHVRQQEAEHMLAVRFQALVRGRLCRSALRTTLLEQQRRVGDLQYGAVKLQAFYRGTRDRRRVAAMRAELERLRIAQIHLAHTTQRVWRGHKGRVYAAWWVANRARIMWGRHMAATHIQRVIRGFLARQVWRALKRDFQLRTRMATHIQRIFRGHTVLHWRKQQRQRFIDNMERASAAARRKAKETVHEKWRVRQQLLAADSASDEEQPDDWFPVVDEHTGKQWFFSPKRAERVARIVDPWSWERALVGKHCRIYWNSEEKWFEGVIVRFNGTKRRFKVQYPDSDTDWIDMHEEASRVQIWHDGAWIMWRSLPRPSKAERDAELLAAKLGDEPDTATALVVVPAAPPAVPVWEEYVDESSGAMYWYNTATGESTWTDPNAPPQVAAQEVLQDAEQAAPVWTQVWSDEYQCYYYYREDTGETTYDPPATAQSADQTP